MAQTNKNNGVIEHRSQNNFHYSLWLLQINIRQSWFHICQKKKNYLQMWKD